MVSTKTETSTQSKLEAYFAENSKFFGSSDINGKKAFFCLGQYTRRVLESEEKHVAESGEENKFQARVVKQAAYNMTYRNFGLMLKLLDSKALINNPELFKTCSGACKQYIINSDVATDKKALSTEDGNMSFSLGLYQKF